VKTRAEADLAFRMIERRTEEAGVRHRLPDRVSGRRAGDKPDGRSSTSTPRGSQRRCTR
jgi:hypothetical protein